MPGEAEPISSEAPPEPQVGLVEVVGQLAAREIYVSGWARCPLPQGMAVSVVTADGREAGRLWSARQDRPDVGAGSGFAGILEFPSAAGIGALRGVSLGEAGVLALYGEIGAVDSRQAAALLQDALRPIAAQKMPEILRRACSRYGGTDTLSATSLPIRLGIDDCASLGEHGVLISGWLFDPERLVRRVTVGAGRASHAISDDWVTQTRSDVAAVMQAEPRFAGYAQPHECHGFMALATMKAGDDLHLIVEMDTALPLHLPLAARTGRPIALLKRFAASLAPEKPSSLDSVDRQIAPLLAALGPDRAGRGVATRRGVADSSTISIVIGCSGDCDDIPALLAILATDASTRNIPIVIAGCRSEIEAFRGDIERAAGLYELDVSIASADGVDDAFDALGVGAEAARSTLVCLVTLDALPRTAGWLPLMQQALNSTRGSCAIVPYVGEDLAAGTLAYHDRSARLSCILLKRCTVLGIGGFEPHFLTPQAKAADFTRRLSASGTRIVQAGGVEFTACAVLGPDMLRASRADRKAAELRAAASRLRIAG